MKIMWCMVPEIQGATDRIFCHFWPFFAHSPPWWYRKSKFEKLKIVTGDIIILHMCKMSDNHMIYGSWSMEYFFVILDHFLPFPSPMDPPKMKKAPGDIIALIKGTVNTIISCIVSEIWSMADRVFVIFEHCLFY